jgi:hypothetical protein
MSIYTFIRLKQNREEKARLEAEQQKKEASKPKKKSDKKKATE